jgi:hypothetical protein
LAEDRVNAWEILFRRALEIVDSVAASGTRFDDWSFGGGTVLMRRFRHRISMDVDIFVPDPQYLGYVSPRLNDTAEIIAKKIWHRGREFTARDIFDLALVATREPGAIESIRPILRERREMIRRRIATGAKALRTTFSGLDTLEFQPSFDECVRIVEDVLDKS